MARYNNKNSEWFEVAGGVSVRGTAERFSLNWFGAIIHGCRIVNGKNGAFISWPSFKGKDGKYIREAYVFAADGSEDAAILGKVIAHVGN